MDTARRNKHHLKSGSSIVSFVRSGEKHKQKTGVKGVYNSTAWGNAGRCQRKGQLKFPKDICNINFQYCTVDKASLPKPKRRSGSQPHIE
ncbi:hypothetical protein CHS0354_034807 [Potamilus streckersoni]|uniref:Uncharacterized protein n=1 Tax=Potamilus streckersoni TaxID=2493646 RepID=A0AAE0RTF0_9BIVA|nr:hypothetical protein CHS0354_034807 [Potamilus streckersoni]